MRMLFLIYVTNHCFVYFNFILFMHITIFTFIIYFFLFICIFMGACIFWATQPFPLLVMFVPFKEIHIFTHDELYRNCICSFMNMSVCFFYFYIYIKITTYIYFMRVYVYINLSAHMPLSLMINSGLIS